MTPGITTWDDLPAVTGNVLLIVNSPAGADHEVASACERVGALGAALHVVAPPAWRERLVACGVAADRTLFAVDDRSDELELNYFLETDKALTWIWRRRFELFACSAAHNLYNEEVKDILEERVSVFLRRGLFVAHALPAPYLYVFDLAGMFARLGRGVKLAEYDRTAEHLVAECYELWRNAGSPARSDAGDFSDVMAVLRRHLGSAVMDFDEGAPTPLSAASGTGRAAAAIAARLGDIVQTRDQALDVSVGAAAWRRTTSAAGRLKRWVAATAGIKRQEKMR